MRKELKFRVGVSLASLLPLAAQEFRATLTGRALDPHDAPIAGASVRNAGANASQQTRTDAQGNYSIAFLQPGDYAVTVEAVGFKKAIREGISLTIGQAVTQEVTVSAAAPLLDHCNAERGGLIDEESVKEFPLNGRNPFMLSMLVPGVDFNGNLTYQRPFDNGAIADWNIGGGGNRNAEFLIDGAPNNAQAGGNNIAYVPPVDSVQEFKIQVNSYDAQYGRSAGGTVNVALKSGGNRVHGSVYEFARRNELDANSFQNNARGFDTQVLSPVDALIDRTKFPGYPTLYGGLLFAGQNGQPRFGMAYSLSSKIVVRGGWGRYYINPNNDFQQTYGFSNSAAFSSSNDGNRTGIPNSIDNPFPTVLTPPGSADGLLTFVGRGFNFVNSKFRIPYSDQFSFEVEDASFRDRCNFALGGNPSYCDQGLPNPFKGLAPFFGTNFYTSNTESRAQLLRPFPQFGACTQYMLNTAASGGLVSGWENTVIFQISSGAPWALHYYDGHVRLTRINERFNLQLRAEAFNVGNSFFITQQQERRQRSQFELSAAGAIAGEAAMVTEPQTGRGKPWSGPPAGHARFRAGIPVAQAFLPVFRVCFKEEKHRHECLCYKLNK